LRRYARSEDDGVLTITFTDVSWLARMVASAGACAEALDPPDLVEAVQSRLAAVARLLP
jgi:predicted DNA-binding transcriptional regulator YafY